MGLFILGAAPQQGWAAANQATLSALPAYQVTVTGYNAVPGQTDDTPYSTSIGVYTNPEIIAARSSDLADELPYGTVIALEPASETSDCGMVDVYDHIGLRVIGDAMNARMRNKVDILFSQHDFVPSRGLSRNAAKAIGFCRDVTIRVVGRIDPQDMPATQEELVAMMGKQLLAAK